MKIKIGSSDYDLCLANLKENVKERKSPESPERKDVNNTSEEDYCYVLGYWDEAITKIAVEKDSSKLCNKLTFWHEVVHGFMIAIGLRELGDDEGFVDALARQLYSFYKNNNIEMVYTYLEKWVSMKHYLKSSKVPEDGMKDIINLKKSLTKPIILLLM